MDDAEARVVVNDVCVGDEVGGVGVGVCGGRVRVREAVGLERALEELEADEREDGEHEEREDAHLAQPLHRLHEREHDRAQACARSLRIS